MIRIFLIFLLVTSSQIVFADKAFDDLLSEAQSGNADAQHELGKKFSKGEGVPQDYQQAFYWESKAAEQGHPKAQNKLGSIYEHGEGVPQDDHKAMDWYKKSADQGFSDAQYNIGLAYAKGTIVPQDFKQGAYWFTKAAGQGDTTSQLNLGLMFFDGAGLPQNYKAAFVFCSLAANGPSPTGANGDPLTTDGVPSAIECRDSSEYRLTHEEHEKAQQEIADLQQSIINPKFEKYSNLVIENPDSKDACIKFIELTNERYSFTAEKNEKIENSIIKNILNNMQSFRPSQREAMSEFLSSSLSSTQDIESGCKTGLSLTESIRKSDAIQSAKSPATKSLEALSKELQQSPRNGSDKCGNGSKLFCDTPIRSEAVSQALAESIKCDKSIGNCSSNINDFIDPIFNELIKKNLLTIKNNHLNADRVDGFDYGMEESCKGIRNEKGVVDDIAEYDKLVCGQMIAYNLNLARKRNIIPANLELISADSSRKISETSQTLRDFILQHEKDTECGELPNIYCEFRLTNAEATLAFNESLECDLANESAKNCPLDMKGLNISAYINSRTLAIKISRLNADKFIYEKYLNQDVEKNWKISQAIDAKARNCQHAKDQKNEWISEESHERVKESKKFRESVCEPQAKAEYFHPAQEVLDKINNKLVELSGHGVPAPSVTPTPNGVAQAPSSTVVANNETVKPVAPSATDTSAEKPANPEMDNANVNAYPAPALTAGSSTEIPLTKPGFDCDKASSANEKLICSDVELSRLDSELSAIYQQAKTSSQDPKALKQGSIAAWKNREATCSDKQCLVKWYAERKATLLGGN